MLPDPELIHPVTHQNHLVVGPVQGPVFNLHLQGMNVIPEPYIILDHSANGYIQFQVRFSNHPG